MKDKIRYEIYKDIIKIRYDQTRYMGLAEREHLCNDGVGEGGVATQLYFTL